MRTYTVVKGDNLWDLAIKYYGDGLRYADIFSANASQIRDPNLIYIGQIFVVPPKPTTNSAPGALTLADRDRLQRPVVASWEASRSSVASDRKRPSPSRMRTFGRLCFTRVGDEVARGARIVAPIDDRPQFRTRGDRETHRPYACPRRRLAQRRRCGQRGSGSASWGSDGGLGAEALWLSEQDSNLRPIRFNGEFAWRSVLSRLKGWNRFAVWDRLSGIREAAPCPGASLDAGGLGRARRSLRQSTVLVAT